MEDNWPVALIVTVRFEALGSKTRMTLTHVGFPEDQHVKLASAGWNESFDKLAASVRQ
jgi:uncharacterized protein YndB with AHSA1/START domain